MSKYFDESLKWKESLIQKTGLPRPYVDVPEHLLNMTTRNNPDGKFYLHKRVPMQFTAKPRLTDRLTDLIIENEKKVVNENLCGYCGVEFQDEEICVIWKKYDVAPFSQGEAGPRVFSDYFPFHLECMEQTLIFCPFMRMEARSDFFEEGPYSVLIKKSKEYKEMIENNFLYKEQE
jgi:hypothetical protein